jgi:hypothetical protein
VRARVILLGGYCGGMTAKIETKNNIIKDFERRVHQNDARHLFAKMPGRCLRHDARIRMFRL